MIQRVRYETKNRQVFAFSKRFSFDLIGRLVESFIQGDTTYVETAVTAMESNETVGGGIGDFTIPSPIKEGRGGIETSPPFWDILRNP